MSTATIDYYNQNAADFAANTVSVEFQDMQEHFTSRLPEQARILDFGCGAGRDTKAFLEQGFHVTAADGSSELCKIASAYTGIPVKQMDFRDLDETEQYDGIWACSSILHLGKQDLRDVLRRMARALKPHGIIYTSFKYGTFEGMRNGRYFTDLTEETFRELMREIEHLKIEEEWITGDARPGRGDEKWLNLILRKT